MIFLRSQSPALKFSRGLDIPQIKTVINYENPKDSETHIHRVGRTGRAGNKDGVAVTLLLEETDVKFATILIKNFELSGQCVTPELETLAMRDDKFKLKRMTQRLGVDFAKGKDASKLLRQALSKGRNSSVKSGLGYTEDKAASKAQTSNTAQQLEDLQ